MTYPYYAVRTAYHGGGIISRHRTEEAAERAVRRWGSSECLCGCAHVVKAEDYEDLPDSHETANPYEAAR